MAGSMTTKRQILISICEHPGWYPSERSSSVDRYLDDLRAEGWIAPRLDGWEATAQALDGYPDFTTQTDIADDSAPAREPEETVAAMVSVDRVATMIAAMLEELPFSKVAALTTLSPSQLGCDTATWHVARTLARRLVS